MARLTVQLGGSLVVPIAAPRRYPTDWRARAFLETGLTAPMRPNGSVATTGRTSGASSVKAARDQPHVEGPAQ